MRAASTWQARELLMAGLFLLALLIIVTQSTGCLTDQQKKDVAFDVYAAQQQACIDQYADRPSIDKCRDRVKAAWLLDHVTEAGAPDAAARTLNFANDNGHPEAGTEAGK